MAIDILAIQPTVISRDLRGKYVLIYGKPKCGKTTAAVQFPRALLCGFEKGYNAIGGVKPVDISKWAEFKLVLRQLEKPEAKAMYDTVTIDKAATIGGLATVNNSMYLTGHIFMGGNKAATGENHIKFSNPDASTNPHNVYIYGGNPSSATAIGLYDAINSRNVITYADKANSIALGNGSANIYFNGNKMGDFVVEAGASSGWTWRKWNGGRMEVYGTASHNPTALNNGVNTMTVTMPVSFVNTSFTVQITPAKAGLLVSACGDCNGSNAITHTVNTFALSYKYNHGQAYTVNFNVMAVGGWK